MPGTIKRGATQAETRQNHQYGIYLPSSCRLASEKAENARRQLAMAEDSINRLSKFYDQQEALAHTIYTFGILRDSCISILDIASEVIPGKAGAVAQAGVSAIETSEQVSAYALGQTSLPEATVSVGHSWVSAVPVDGLAGNAIKHSTKVATGGIEVAVTAGSEAQKEAVYSYSIETLVDNAQLQLDALGQAGVVTAPAAKVGLGAIRSTLKAAGRVRTRYRAYQSDLAAVERGRTTIIPELKAEVKTHSRNLEAAVEALEACRAEVASSPSMRGF